VVYSVVYSVVNCCVVYSVVYSVVNCCVVYSVVYSVVKCCVVWSVKDVDEKYPYAYTLYHVFT
jgi:hypothetical protein